MLKTCARDAILPLLSWIFLLHLSLGLCFSLTSCGHHKGGDHTAYQGALQSNTTLSPPPAATPLATESPANSLPEEEAVIGQVQAMQATSALPTQQAPFA